jgi:hypothetical protein
MSDMHQNGNSAIPVPLGIPELWSLKHRARLYKHLVCWTKCVRVISVVADILNVSI